MREFRIKVNNEKTYVVKAKDYNQAVKTLHNKLRDNTLNDSISKYNGEDAIRTNGFVKIKEDGDWTSYKYNGSDFDNAVFKIHQYNPSLIAFVSNGNRTITVRNKYLKDSYITDTDMKTAEDIIKKYGGNPVGNVMGLQKTRFVGQDEIKNQHDFATDLDKAGYKFYLINGRYRISPKDSSIKDVSYVSGKKLKIGQKIVEDGEVLEVVDIKETQRGVNNNYRDVTFKNVKTGATETVHFVNSALVRLNDYSTKYNKGQKIQTSAGIHEIIGYDPVRADVHTNRIEYSYRLKTPNGTYTNMPDWQLEELVKLGRYKLIDSSIQDADPVKVEKIIRKEKSALGVTYYIFQTKSSSGYTIYYQVTDKTYHGEPTYSGGGIISFSLQSANDTLDHNLLIDKLKAKYGEKEGTKRYLRGENDSAINDKLSTSDANSLVEAYIDKYKYTHSNLPYVNKPKIKIFNSPEEFRDKFLSSYRGYSIYAGGLLNYNGYVVKLFTSAKDGKIESPSADNIFTIFPTTAIKDSSSIKNRISYDDLKRTINRVMEEGNDKDVVNILIGQLAELKKDYETDINNSKLDKEETKRHYNEYKRLVNNYKNSHISKEYTNAVNSFLSAIKDSANITELTKKAKQLKNKLKKEKAHSYENWGQAEIRQLKDLFDYNNYSQSTKIINEFINWVDERTPGKIGDSNPNNIKNRKSYTIKVGDKQYKVFAESESEAINKYIKSKKQ